MSAWTSIKWVADCLNREYGMKFFKTAKADPNHYLKLLADDRDAYLPPKHDLVQLLDRFLELAELRCNYILLPDRDMNTARYNCAVNGKTILLYDEVPAKLYHIFDREWFGKYFVKRDEKYGKESVSAMDAVKWIKRECLECGFKDGIIDKEHVIPFLDNIHGGEAKWLTEEAEIREALIYMINFLDTRQKNMEKNPYIMLVTREKAIPDLNMHYYHEYI